MPLIICEINVQLTYQQIVLLPIQQAQRHSELTHARLYALEVVSLLTQDNPNLLQQLNAGQKGNQTLFKIGLTQ